MKNILSLVLLSMVLFTLSCQNKHSECEHKTTPCDSLALSASENLVMAVVWYQKSAEMRAMYYQCYNQAKFMVEKKSAVKSLKKKAVILDIDETVLDNSPFEAKMISIGKSFNSTNWREWSNLAQAKALPGVADFLNFAKSKGVEIFYVTNRDDEEKEATMKNMQNENLPFVDDKHCMFRINKESDKTKRRNLIAKDYDIILLIGDNLRDFDELFAKREGDLGFGLVDENKDKFGDMFIMLPNPMYGEWEKAVLGGKYPEKDSTRISLLKEKLDIGY